MAKPRFLANENIPGEALRIAKQRGVDIVSVSETASGLSDDKVLELAGRVGRTVVTFDKDFGELVFRLKRHSNGVVLLRFVPRSSGQVSEVMLALLEKGIEFGNSFVVVEEDRLRVVPLGRK